MKLYIITIVYSFLPSFLVHLGKMRDACSVVLCNLREDKEEEGKDVSLNGVPVFWARSFPVVVQFE